MFLGLARQKIQDRGEASKRPGEAETALLLPRFSRPDFGLTVSITR